MEGLGVLRDMLPFLVPLIIIQIILVVIALVDLVKRELVLGGNKIIWMLVIIFINIIGPIVYLAIGRKEGRVDGN